MLVFFWFCDLLDNGNNAGKHGFFGSQQMFWFEGEDGVHVVLDPVWWVYFELLYLWKYMVDRGLWSTAVGVLRGFVRTTMAFHQLYVPLKVWVVDKTCSWAFYLLIWSFGFGVTRAHPACHPRHPRRSGLSMDAARRCVWNTQKRVRAGVRKY